MLTPERQQELVAINRVLATLVVVLAFSTGILLGKQNSWFHEETTPFFAVQEAVGERERALPAVTAEDLAGVFYSARPQRDFDETATLSEENIARLLWATQGQITDWGERTVPSYKSKFPLMLHVLITRDGDLQKGLYRYHPKTHSLTLVKIEDFDALLKTIEQPSVKVAPATLIVSMPLNENLRETAEIEAGGALRNAMIMATSLGMGSVPLMPHTTPTLDTLLKAQQFEIIQLLPVGPLRSET